MNDNDFFPDLDNDADKWANYTAYEQLHGDMGDHRSFNFSHGDWIVVGHGEKTNGKCGVFRRYNGCLNVDLHGHGKLNQLSQAGNVFVHMVHHWCHSYSCPVCFLRGACLREAEHATQRLEFGSKGGRDAKDVYHAPRGQPQHIIVSAPKSDWDLAEFHHEDFSAKVRRIIGEVGIEGGCLVFHGFRYANYQESLEKGLPFGYYWSPHFHVVGFIVGGYGACRHCSKTAKVVHTAGGKTVTKHGDKRFCVNCDGFEHRVRESYDKHGYIISNTDERTSVFGTVWYQMSHMAIKKQGV